MGADTSGVVKREAGYYGTETGDAQVSGGSRVGVVAVVGESVWGGGDREETVVRRQLENRGSQRTDNF